LRDERDARQQRGGERSEAPAKSLLSVQAASSRQRVNNNGAGIITSFPFRAIKWIDPFVGRVARAMRNDRALTRLCSAGEDAARLTSNVSIFAPDSR
jgi:hypothetical protein